MKKDYKNREQFDAANLLVLIYKYKIPFAIVVLLTVIVSSVASLMIKPKYKSSVILFPASSSSISQSLLAQNGGQKELLKFGEEEEVEQMMQVLQSNAIRQKIIDKFDLMRHYDIDLNSKYPNTLLYKEYESNIKIERTEFMSVNISVLDHDAQMAADIANEISAQYDSVMNKMQQERSKKAYALVETEFLKQKQKIKAIRDTLRFLGDKGIVEYESQSEMFNEQYAAAVAKGNFQSASRLKVQLDTLAKYGSTYLSLSEQLTSEIKKLSEIESKFIEAKLDVEQDLPHKFVVNNAVKAERKSYPIRWLIVLISTVSVVLLSIILLIIIDNIKKK